VIRPREGRAWLVDWHGECGVLRHAPVSEDSLSSIRSVDDVIWIHAFLERLVELDFPSPKPLPAFDGKSWTRAGGVLWEIVSFLPGDAVGWADEPPMEEIGAMLARYHAAARQVQVSSQRPKALPLAEVPSVLLGHETQVIHSHYQRSVIRKLADQLAKDLDDSGHRDRATLVIHGDFTNHNVIADGKPAHPTGVIDFALGHAETPLADIGYGLWRSGRPHQDADYLDLSRVRRFFRGYVGEASVRTDEASVIPLYMRGRGLQMIAKRLREGRTEMGMLTQVQWLTANGDAIGDDLVAALA
jgi:Ser/Thr protein kinase RdoA (MazF antagonist)